MLDGVGVAMEKGLYELKIDPEFKNFLPALSEEKTQNLRDSLIANGCIDPIVTWNGIIIDGHNRYGICQELKIPFDYVEKDFADRDEAKFFMLQTQVCRRELTVFQKCEIVYPFEAFVAEQVEKQRRKAISIYRKMVRLVQICTGLKILGQPSQNMSELSVVCGIWQKH